MKSIFCIFIEKQTVFNISIGITRSAISGWMPVTKWVILQLFGQMANSDAFGGLERPQWVVLAYICHFFGNVSVWIWCYIVVLNFIIVYFYNIHQCDLIERHCSLNKIVYLVTTAYNYTPYINVMTIGAGLMVLTYHVIFPLTIKGSMRKTSFRCRRA